MPTQRHRRISKRGFQEEYAGIGGAAHHRQRQTKYVTFQLAEVAAPCELFAAALDRIQRLGVPPPLVRNG
jgi:hypothetical protein